MIRRLLADALEAACEWIDALPDWTWRIPLVHRLGCPRGLALLACRIDPPTLDDRKDRP